MAPKSVADLKVWQSSMSIIRDVYSMTRAWRREELYGLTGQTRRAAVFVAANLAEGVGRRSAGDFCRFAQIALGSLYELDTLLEVAAQLGFSGDQEVRPKVAALIRQTTNLIRYQQSKRTKPPTNH